MAASWIPSAFARASPIISIRRSNRPGRSAPHSITSRSNHGLNWCKPSEADGMEPSARNSSPATSMSKVKRNSCPATGRSNSAFSRFNPSTLAAAGSNWADAMNITRSGRRRTQPCSIPPISAASTRFPARSAPARRYVQAGGSA